MNLQKLAAAGLLLLFLSGCATQEERAAQQKADLQAKQQRAAERIKTYQVGVTPYSQVLADIKAGYWENINSKFHGEMTAKGGTGSSTVTIGFTDDSIPALIPFCTLLFVGSFPSAPDDKLASMQCN